MSNINGFIKLHRKLIEWGWYSDSVVKDVFLHILMTANFKPGTYQGYDLKPGQAIIGRKRMSIELGFSEQQIRTALKKLESTGEITLLPTNRFTIATVENWGIYQCDDMDSQPTDNQQITNNQPHLKNEKKDKKDKNEKKARNIIPPPRNLLEAYIAKNHFQVDADRFYDFYESKGWLIGKQKMKDWQAAVRTWARKENHGDKPDAEPKSGNRQGDYDYSGFFVNGRDF